MLLEEMYGRILLRISLSKFFAKKGKRLIGRYEEGISGGFLGFGNTIIVENFQSYESKLILERHSSKPLTGQLLLLGGIWLLPL